jgi:hypothetical protein
MPRELRRLAHALALSTATVGGRPGWKGQRIVVGAVGVGTVAAAAGATRILADHRPARVLIVGVAGAVDKDLAIADVIAPRTVVDAASGAAWAPHGAGRATTPARVRTLATVPHFGAPLPAETSAVDMETAAIAAQCERLGIPWDVRRAVSDLPGALHPTVPGLVGPDGRADIPAVVRLLARHPRQLAGLVRLGRDTTRAIKAVSASVLAELRAMGLLETS